MTMAAEEAGLQCPCGTSGLQPTLPGGNRPRAHHTPQGVFCRVVADTGSICKRCGGSPDKPKDGCRSAMFHPEVWRVGDRQVGNAAAAGAILGVSGEHYAAMTRPSRPEPRRAPSAVGFDQTRRASYYALAAVQAFATTRAGIPQVGDASVQKKPRDPAE